MRRALPLLALPLVVGLTACSGSVSIGKKVLDKSDIETTVKSRLQKQVGQPVKKVTCPDDLDAKVGAKMTCRLYIPNGESVDVVVKVTSTKDGGANYTAVAGHKVYPAPK